MPEDGVPLQPAPALLTAAEIERLATLFASVGVNKIRLTGGEPLVRKDIEEIATSLGKVPGITSLAITTNGITLAKKLPVLHKAGVNLLNISLDTLVPAKFTLITRRLGWERVMESIKYGYDPVKVNCVVMRGVNEDELADFVELTRNKPISVRFIEYMPFGGNNWKDSKFVPYLEMIKIIQKKFSSFGKSEVPDGPNETARLYQVPGFRYLLHLDLPYSDYSRGSVGFITSMSDHFCDSCNRLRITADGNLKVCLFGKEEVSLRDAMRKGASDQDLLEVIQAAVLKKKPSHGGIADTRDTVARNPHIALFSNPNWKAFSLLGGSPVHSGSFKLSMSLLPACSRYSSFLVKYFHTERNPELAAKDNHAHGFTHVDANAVPTMVSVIDKTATKRFAYATSIVQFPEHVLQALVASSLPQSSPQQGAEINSAKGPVFSTAIIAGTMAVKKTHDLIPFCHPLPIESCKISIQVISTTEVEVSCKVAVTHKTGVEMEAMVGASVAALTIYDMCKALSHEIVIKETKLVEKTGGKSKFVAK